MALPERVLLQREQHTHKTFLPIPQTAAVDSSHYRGAQHCDSWAQENMEADCPVPPLTSERRPPVNERRHQSLPEAPKSLMDLTPE